MPTTFTIFILTSTLDLVCFKILKWILPYLVVLHCRCSDDDDNFPLTKFISPILFKAYSLTGRSVEQKILCFIFHSRNIYILFVLINLDKRIIGSKLK